MSPSLSLLFIFALLCSSISAQRAGFGQAVQKLTTYQAKDGGFVAADGVSSASSTSDALILASLYGVKSRIDTEAAIKYLRSLENADYGYGQTTDSASDVEATRAAIIALEAMGVKTSNPSKTANYLQTLADKSSGLFSNKQGEKQTIEATANALQCLKLLGELDERWVVDLIPRLNDYLSSTLVGASAFSPDTSENYKAILAGSISGFEFGEPLKYAQHIGGLQNQQNGLFYDNAVTRSQTNLVATCDAMLSLFILDGIANNPSSRRFTDAVNVNAIRNALRYLAPDLSTAAHAHLSLAVTRAFKDNFQVVAALHGADQQETGTVLEGTDVTPLVSVLFRDGNVPHEGFSVSARSLFHGAAQAVNKMKYSKENRGYIGEVISTLGRFGPVNVLYSLINHIPGLGPIGFDIPETKSVGYGIDVKSQAVVEATGREVKEGEEVAVGTHFEFAVTLRTLQNADYFSGDFHATFSVLDSANVEIYTETIDGTTNNKPITFEYTLQTAAIPAGSLSFKFEVSTKAGVAHTTKTVSYNYSPSMLATKITFEGKKDPSSFKLGETIRVSMEPATNPDHHSVYPLDIPSSSSSSRQFFLDVRTPAGTLIESYPATSTDGAKYTFKFTPEAHLKFLNKNAISFRYKPATGADVELDNYDLTSDEVLEEEIEFEFKSDLKVTDIQEQPTPGSLAYGADVILRYKIQDKVSGVYVTGSNGSYAGAYLALQHADDDGRTYTSLSIPSQPTETIKGDVYYVARWTVNPNAYNGDAVLTVVAKDAEGKSIPLKDAPQIKVNIGGDIQVEEEVFTSSALDTTHAAFVAELTIVSGNKTLENANLRARVTLVGRKQEHIATIPVAHSKGRYTVSWISPLSSAVSGTYQLDFFREVDRQRAIDRKTAKDLKTKREKQAKGEIDTSEPVSDSETIVEPIFSVTLPYTAPVSSLPVKAEFVALVFFGSVVGWLISQRANLK